MDLYELLEAMAQPNCEERAEAVAELVQLATRMVRDFEREGFSRRQAIELSAALLTLAVLTKYAILDVDSRSCL
jgi:hypothetical protein